MQINAIELPAYKRRGYGRKYQCVKSIFVVAAIKWLVSGAVLFVLAAGNGCADDNDPANQACQSAWKIKAPQFSDVSWNKTVSAYDRGTELW